PNKTPASKSSSLNLFMSAMSWGSGGAPSFSAVALTMTMNRILFVLSGWGWSDVQVQSLIAPLPLCRTRRCRIDTGDGFLGGEGILRGLGLLRFCNDQSSRFIAPKADCPSTTQRSWLER